MSSVVNQLDAEIYWAQVPEWVLLAPISDRAVRLYGLLARRAGAKGSAFPSRGWLAEHLRCSVKSVDRALEELLDCGAILKHNQFKEKRQTVNRYVIMAMKRTGVTREGDTGDAPEGDTGDAQKESHREESQNVLAAAPRERKPRARDPIWDAIVEACGYVNPTGTEAGRAQKAGKELREIGATPEQVHQVAAAYRKKWPDMPVTPQALTGNWNQLLETAKPRKKSWSETNWCPNCKQDADDIYHEELCDAYQRHR